MLRLALVFAMRDGVITTNPIDGLESAEHKRPEPDLFSVEEAEAISAALAARGNNEVARYFGFKFYTGLRTSESLGLQWSSIDWRKGTLAVSDAVVLGEYKGRTKTHDVRQIQLNSRALQFLKNQKPATFLHKAGWIFPDPRTGERWTDD